MTERLRSAEIDGQSLRDLYEPMRQKMIEEGETKLTRRHIITLANMINAWPMAVAWKLEKLGLAKRGTYAWLKNNGGITKAQIAGLHDELLAPTKQKHRRQTAE